MKYLLLLLVLFCLSFKVDCQTTTTLDPREITSAVWLVRQYHQSIASEDQAGICGSPSLFACTISPSDGLFHITAITFYSGSASPAAPDPSLTELYLPAMTSFYVYSLVADVSQNILDKAINWTQVIQLSIYNDYSITVVPVAFPIGMPNLKELTISSPNLATCMGFFNGAPSLTTLQLLGPLNYFTIDSSIYLPSLQSLTIGFALGVNSTITFESTSFPNLISFQYDYTGVTALMTEFVTINFNSPILQSSYSNAVTDLPGGLIQNFNVRTNIQQINVIGQHSQVNPPTLDSYPNLIGYKTTYRGDSVYPFTNYPSKATSMNFAVNKYTTFPPGVPPPSLSYLDLSHNLVVGAIPSNFFDLNTTTGLNLYSNPGITGDLDNRFCHLQNLAIQNTSITSIPDCYWCYKANINSILSTDLVQPTTINCSISIDSHDLILIDTQLSFYGTNIGWGKNIKTNNTMFTYYPYGAIKPIPNRILTLYAAGTPDIQTFLKVSLQSPDPAYDVVFNITDATIQTLGSMVLLNKYPAQPLFQLMFSRVNFNIPMTLLINGTQPCTIVSTDQVNKKLNCTVPHELTMGDYYVNLTNAYNGVTLYGSYYRDPLVTAIAYDPPSYPVTDMLMYGYFGDPSSSAMIVVGLEKAPNYTFCIADQQTRTGKFLKCRFNTTDGNPLPPGPTALGVQIGTVFFISMDMVYIPFAIPLPINDTCPQITNNCNGHGKCVNGQCQCNIGYSEADNCASPVAPLIEIKPNTTDPVGTIGNSNYTFSFSMIRIEELDSTNVIVNSVDTTNWIYSDQSTKDLTSLQYKFNNSKYPGFNLTNVITRIEFSKKARNVPFGPTTVSIGAGSIKIGVNITGWPYQSLLSHLRVVFTTTINNEQFISNCNNTQVDITSFDFLEGTDNAIKYLRVVKDDIQFVGRFLNYSISDGRATFSKSELLNLTQIGGTNESTALIGIHLPQCEVCQLDPDFSLLLIDKSSYGAGGFCPKSSDSNTWKIIVGVVVGGVAAIAITVAIVVVAKNNKQTRKSNKRMQAKLESLNSK